MPSTKNLIYSINMELTSEPEIEVMQPANRKNSLKKNEKAMN
jgi:hypothetical protein